MDYEYVIKTEGLSKTYGWLFWKKPEPSLDDLNLAIPKGVVFGFLGPNGAGKTTTIRLLMDLIKPTAGSAKVLGQPSDNVDVKIRIGFLPDTPAFSTYLSAYEFLNICAKLLKIPSNVRKKRIEEVLDEVKMLKHAKSKLGGFSRGMIQRIGIAQAILNKPELLILDEPLVGLDPHGRQELKDIINAQRASGTNVFFCSHILSDVEKICDHIGILSKGKLLCCGALDDLLSEKGVHVKIAAEREDVAKDLLGDATTTEKSQDGEWTLFFEGNGNDKLKDKLLNLEKTYSDEIKIVPAKENLEKFFFRQIEASLAKS